MDFKAVKEEHTSFPFCRIIIRPSCRTTWTRSEVLDMICTTFNNLKSLSLLQKSSNMYVTWLLFQLTPSSWTRQSTTISSVKMFAAQKQTKQSPLGRAWPGQPGSCSLSWLYSPHYLADLPPRVSHSSSSFHWYCYKATKVMLCRACRRAMKMKRWKLKPAHISCPGSCIENWMSRPSVTVDFLDIVK